jgi:uncharacterized protein (TIRG00374 family)
MGSGEEQVLRPFRPRQALWPVLLGLGVTFFLVFRSYDAHALDRIDWTGASTFWMAMAVLSVVVRDAAYMVRVRVLTGGELTWGRSFVVIMLWEFASALAPGIIGGGFLFAIFILTREGVDTGRSISLITFTSFLDGIFLAVMAPLAYWTVGAEGLFGIIEGEEGGATGIFISFWVVYTIIVLYKLFVAYALFIDPVWVKRALVGISNLRLLRRWKRSMVITGDQLITAAHGLKRMGWSFWLPALLATFVSWTARYSIVNCILHAFNDPGMPVNDLVVYGKQVVMGIIVLLSPTPGGSGLAEFIFHDFLGMLVPTGLAPMLAFLWRGLSYYPYIAIGLILLPRWVREKVWDVPATSARPRSEPKRINKERPRPEH